MAGASARCGAEDAGIATLEVDSGRSCSRSRTSSPAIFGVQGHRFRSYSMFQNLNSAKAYSKSFLKMVSNTVRVLWLLREGVLTSVQRLANPAVYRPSSQRRRDVRRAEDKAVKGESKGCGTAVLEPGLLGLYRKGDDH